MIIWDTETNLIVRQEADGSLGFGDSCAETFRYYHLLYVRSFLGISNEGLPHQSLFEFARSFKAVQSKDGFHFQRAPTEKLPPEWGDPVKDFSSDQAIPLICAAGAYGLWGEVAAYKNNLGWRWQNGQFISPDGYSVFKRALGQTPSNFQDAFMWPTDLARTGVLPSWDTGLKKFQWGDPTDVEDDINFWHQLFQCEYRGHTWMSQKAKGHYRKNRDVLHVLATYYGGGVNQQLYDIYRPVLQKVFETHDR